MTESVVTVSYTHLDVYKRQAYDVNSVVANFYLFESIRNLLRYSSVDTVGNSQRETRFCLFNTNVSSGSNNCSGDRTLIVLTDTRISS